MRMCGCTGLGQNSVVYQEIDQDGAASYQATDVIVLNPIPAPNTAEPNVANMARHGQRGAAATPFFFRSSKHHVVYWRRVALI